jgi:hypothetical protein
MPEYRLHQKLESLGISIYIFERNFAELRDLLVALASGPQAESLYAVKNHDKLVMLARDVIRRLHNFVAASMSLESHTRNLYRDLYADGDRFHDYQHRVDKDFAQDPLSHFIKCLRQYCQHYQALDLLLTTSWSEENERLARTIGPSLDNLRSFSRWTPEAKTYLRSLDKQVDLLEVAIAYRSKVVSFYQWFGARQSEIHAVELQSLEAKRTDLTLMELEDKVDVCLAWDGEGMPFRNDEVFLGIFSSKEFEALEKIDTQSPDHAAHAIQILDNYVPVSENLKGKITRMYQLPGLFVPRAEGKED